MKTLSFTNLIFPTVSCTNSMKPEITPLFHKNVIKTCNTSNIDNQHMTHQIKYHGVRMKNLLNEFQKNIF